MAAVLALSSCANQFTSSYRPLPGTGAAAFQAYSGQTQIVDSVQVRADVAHWETLGYGVVGVSSFVDTAEGSSQVRGALMAQASKIGADVVIAKARADGTEVVSSGSDYDFSKDNPMGGDQHRRLQAGPDHSGTLTLQDDKYVAVYLRRLRP